MNIYKIENIVNKKIYIGSETLDKSRWKNHFHKPVVQMKHNGDIVKKFKTIKEAVAISEISRYKILKSIEEKCLVNGFLFIIGS